jgi:hypothetical protein
MFNFVVTQYCELLSFKFLLLVIKSRKVNEKLIFYIAYSKFFTFFVQYICLRGKIHYLDT